MESFGRDLGCGGTVVVWTWTMDSSRLGLENGGIVVVSTHLMESFDFCEGIFVLSKWTMVSEGFDLSIGRDSILGDKRCFVSANFVIRLILLSVFQGLCWTMIILAQRFASASRQSLQNRKENLGKMVFHTCLRIRIYPTEGLWDNCPPLSLSEYWSSPGGKSPRMF